MRGEKARLGKKPLVINQASGQTANHEAGRVGCLSFDNLSHLASLDPEDFLSLRLYTNNDSANILWEYAFWYVNAQVVDDGALQGDDIYYVNADNPILDLRANLIGYSALGDDNKAKSPKKILWKVTEGNAAVSPRVATLDETGGGNTSVTLDPNSSNIVQVNASLIDGESSIPITIGVIPGKPSSIEISTAGTAYLKGKGSVSLEATVRDKNNNLVANGTGVLIREHGHINVKTSTGVTNQGKVQATLVGGSVSGSYQVEVLSGEAVASTNISVSPLSVTVDGIPPTLNPGELYRFTAKVVGSGGSLDGIFLDLGADGGMISDRDTVTDSNGELSFSYRAPKEPGLYELGVRLDLSDPKTFGLSVGNAIAQPLIAQEREFVVAGGENIASITNFRGESASIEYPLKSSITLHGEEGGNWSLSLSDPHLPNVEPVYFSRFNELYWDSTKKYSSYAEQVNRVRSLHDGIYAINQYENEVVSPWALNSSDDFLIDSPSYNFWLNLGGDGQVLSIAGGSITLQYSSGVLEALAQSLDGDGINQRSLASVSGLSENQWYSVAIRIKDGVLMLAVDGQQAVVEMAGSSPNYNNIASDDPWLSVGNTFTGRVAGLRIYDLDRPKLLQLSQSSGVYDVSGTVVVTVELTPEAKQADLGISSVTVGIVDGSNNVSTMNVLSKQALDNMALVMHAVSSRVNLHADEVVGKMPLHQYFPDPKVSVSNYVSSFALQSIDIASVENTLANLAWLKLDAKFPVLHFEVEKLQSYFSDSLHPEMPYYSVEYLQEATVQASYGNNFYLRAMATALKVWGEMLDGHSEEANQIAKAIQNRADFGAWIRILSIPANGWATDSVPVPRPDITCDAISPMVNIGTPLEYGVEPCRASGSQMASLIQVLNAVDPETLERPELLTTYFIHILAGTRQMPLEYRKWFSGTSSDIAWNINHQLFPEAHAILPAWVAYGFRAMAITLRQLIRKAAGGAPANFVAFMQGGTTSRVTPKEILPAIAYLGTRLNGAPEALCNGCKRLNPQVSDTVEEDIAAWLVSLGMADKGEIAEERERSEACSIAYLNHGKGFEILGTAMYHGLYEFGGLVGIENPAKYEILLSDPRTRNEWIDVGLMQNGPGGSGLDLYDKFHRKPDLVLAGNGEGERTWVEFKSWLYNQSILDKAEYWKGFKSESDRQYTNANRQYILDFAATRDSLQAAYWDKQNPFLQSVKPGRHLTWFQVWKGGVREWRELKKGANGKYYLEEKSIHRSVSRPWISTDEIVTTVDNNFQKLQRFIAGVGSELKSDVYETSIGYAKSMHNVNHRDKQVSSNFADLLQSNIRPFNVKTFLALELGSESGDQVAKLKKELYDAIGEGDFARLQEAIDENRLTEEQIKQMRELISEQIDTMLGPLEYLLFDIPGMSDLENALADSLLGEELEEARKAIVDYDLPEDILENLCEDQ